MNVQERIYTLIGRHRQGLCHDYRHTILRIMYIMLNNKQSADSLAREATSDCVFAGACSGINAVHEFSISGNDYNELQGEIAVNTITWNGEAEDKRYAAPRMSPVWFV
jgi:hypothetical protein